MNRFARVLLASLVLALFVAGPVFSAGGDPATTPATGPSLLSKWSREMRTSALGRLGDGEAAANGPSDQLPAEWIREGFVIDGEDLFRYDCRSCHGDDGAGLPPEIRPLTGVSDEAILRHRISEGGAVMPALGHFVPEESTLLIDYIALLRSGEEPGSALPTLRLPADRVGEHIVKGSCQVCHDATKKAFLRPISDQDIPTLRSFTNRHSVDAFLTHSRHLEVREGEVRQGRGPRYRYLSDDELTAAYLYLAVHPPE